MQSVSVETPVRFPIVTAHVSRETSPPDDRSSIASHQECKQSDVSRAMSFIDVTCENSLGGLLLLLIINIIIIITSLLGYYYTY